MVWNLVNALRDDPPRPSMDVDYGARVRGHVTRDSVAESLSESLISNENSSNYGNRHSQSQDDDLPWRVGPTPTPAFMRRPDTRVYYTSSADVSDLIDQLSSDLAGAARGRIDIRPTSPGRNACDEDEQAYAHAHAAQSIAARLDGANHHYEPGQFSDAPSPLNVPPKRDASLLRPDAHRAYSAGVFTQNHAGPSAGASGEQYHVGSPSAASWTGSDISSPEQSVQDRLQALMDRLRSAPGGVGRAG